MTDQAPSTRTEVRATFVQQLPLLLGLVVLWMLLWGAVSWLNLLTGAIVALVVTRVFYLPPVELSGRFNPFWFLVFAARLVSELVVASFQVALLAMRPRKVEHNAVIAVQLRTRSDIIMTGTAISMSLVPGSLIVEADRMHSILYLHSLNVRDEAAVQRVKEHALRYERALVRAFGSADDLERTRA